MEYIILGLFVFSGIGFLSLHVFEKRKLAKEKELYVNQLSAHGNITEEDGKIYFSKENIHVEILFFQLKQNEELIINSRVMWEIFRMRKAMLLNQTEFLKSESHKWIIIYPSTGLIKRYINENELLFVKKEDIIYDYQVILGIELNDFLEGFNHVL